MIPTGPAYIYRATALAVHDGDTFTADLDLGLYVHLRIAIRIADINAPELSTGVPGYTARDALKQRIGPWATAAPPPLLLQTRKTKSGTEEQSFARWVADVWVPDNAGAWTNVGDWMVAAGYAVVHKP